MKPRRIIRRVSPAADAIRLPQTLHPVLRRIYRARGVRGAEDLDLSLERLLPIRSLGGSEAAVDLLLRCHRGGGSVLVIGDFDADGATSTAVVVRQLRRLGFTAPQFLVPDRFKFGYGLTPEIVRVAATLRPGLIVTVDNGVSSLEGVAEARRLGIDVLVTDHHLPGAVLPDAAAIVNPNLPGEPFASKALAGVGVAFYVMAALTRRMRDDGSLPAGSPTNPADLLDLVALGTVADVVPLDFNNRILVAQGLRRIRAGRCVPGLRALLEASGRRLEDVIGQDLGFQAGPRLNAAGRLEDMTLGIDCLLTDEASEARELAQRLAQLNSDRRELEARMQGEALVQVDALVATLEGELPARVVPVRRGLAPGRDRARGLARQGTPAPAGDRIRTRRSRLARGIGTFGAGPARARRARCGGRASPGFAREVRRSRDGGGHDAARRAPARLRTAFAVEVDRCTGNTLSDLYTDRPVGAGGPHRRQPSRCAKAALGAGFPEPRRRALRRARHARRRARTSS